MEYTTSTKELQRRKKAFATLLASTGIGLLLASAYYQYSITLFGCALVVGVFLVIGFITFRFLSSVAGIRLLITDGRITRIGARGTSVYHISDIRNIRIKRRVRGKIREMYLWFRNNQRLFLTAFENDFENISHELTGALPQNVIVHETRERIDFDHPLFYSLLGLPIGFFCIVVRKYLSEAGTAQLQRSLEAFAVFVFLFGVYFVVQKPISARYENRRAGGDYVFGILFIGAGALMFFLRFLM